MKVLSNISVFLDVLDSSILPGSKAYSVPSAFLMLSFFIGKHAVASAPNCPGRLGDPGGRKNNIKYAPKGLLTERLLAELFGGEVLVPRGAVSTAVNAAAGTYWRIASKKILLCYAPEKPSILAPSDGHIFAWKGYFGTSRFGSRVKKFRMENLESDRIE
jgi:hypothetical protein